MDDRVVDGYDSSELAIAAEFLRNWLPFLTRDLCSDCSAKLRDRIHSLHAGPSSHGAGGAESPQDFDPAPAPTEIEKIEPTGWDTDPVVESPKARMSWADMAQEDELEEAEEGKEDEKKEKPKLSREQREYIRFNSVGRKKDFICLERVKGKIVNILDGLELHTGVFSAAEQKRIVDFVYELQEKGRNSELGERTYSEPTKWMRGKGRVTLQFGCCYNYAVDQDGNPAGILRHIVSDPIPLLFKVIIKRLVQWHVLPPSCVPDSCIVNIYEPGDCIPPHIDNHDFVRPFCTVSFLSECSILFGSELKIEGPGEFTGSIAIPLPVGSVLVLNGNSADVAKHCVPSVTMKRISITFRKMDENKWPISFTPEPDLQDIQPLPYGSNSRGSLAQTEKKISGSKNKNRRKGKNPGKKLNGIEIESNRRVNHSVHRDEVSLTTSLSALHQNAEGRPSMNGCSSRRASEPSSRSSESKRRPDFRGIRRLLHEAASSNVQVRSDEKSSSWNGGDESLGRKARMEQRQIVVNRNMDGEEESATVSKGMQESPHYSGIRIQAFNNGWRRVSLSDD